jgi:hypothetical protein
MREGKTGEMIGESMKDAGMTTGEVCGKHL